MHFVGIDLAWGNKNNTGLCAVEQDGSILGSTLAKTDDEIISFLAPHLGFPVLVGIDAPLIVNNESGQRTCDRLMSSVFGHRHASVHAANRAMPIFADGGRAARLARVLRLEMSPAISFRGDTSNAIEVYPHSAIVALFHLDRILQYKAKTGRTIESRKIEFERLIGHLESLSASEPQFRLKHSPSWTRLREDIRLATRSGQLDRAEDELDAFVCAYVALYYWYWGLERCAVIGTGPQQSTDGFIVTPVDADARLRLEASRPCQFRPLEG